MSSPGWYPDPSGQPNSFRYWDGQAWSQQTTDNPYTPPPGAWQEQPQAPQQPQQGYGVDPDVTQRAPEQPMEQSPAAGEQPQQWGDQGGQAGAQAWGDQPSGTQPAQPSAPGTGEQAQQWGGDQQAAQQWGQQPDQQGWDAASAAGAGAAGAAAAGGWPADPAQQQWGDAGQQQWGGDSTQQFAATPAAGAGGAGGWGTGGGDQWSPMGDGGNGGGGSEKAIGIVIVAVVVIALIVGGIFGALALMGDDDDDSKGDDDKSSQTQEPTDDPTTDDPTSDGPTDDTTTDEPTDDTTTDGPDDIPSEPVADFCTSGDPTDRESHPSDGKLYGGPLVLPEVKGYIVPPSPVEEVYRFADDVATFYRETQPQKWMSVLAVGGVEKEDAGSDLEAAATAVMECMANSSEFYQNMSNTNELTSEAVTVDGHDAWRVRWEIEVADPEVEAGGDVAEVVLVDTGDEESYGLFAGVVPLNDKQLIKRMDNAVGNLSVQ